MKMNNNMLMINLSPWPILLTINSFSMFSFMIFNMNFKMNTLMIFNILMLSMVLIKWNLYSNSSKMIFGYKNFFMNLSMKMSMMLFIMSEMMFFLTFFYIYFSNKFFMNLFYKKFYIKMFKLNFLISALNLVILISSSISFMIFIKMNKMNKKENKFIFLTITLSIYFMMVQLMEYWIMEFNLSNSMFMSNFFMLTSFHMLHVFMGTMLIMNSTMNKFIFLNNLFIKMMNICWYWHFIDFIWMLIFFLIY